MIYIWHDHDSKSVELTHQSVNHVYTAAAAAVFILLDLSRIIIITIIITRSLSIIRNNEYKSSHHVVI